VKKERLLDVVVGLCSEAFAVQGRAFARGSDGLAEVTEDDLRAIVLPEITDKKVRAELQTFVRHLLAGQVTIKATVEQLIHASKLPFPLVAPRPSHVVLV
jgi:type I restriction enzyme M protein